ncbi:hypothetical protein GCM10027422_35420 [Hymenobacter arcticus]
MLLVLLPAVTSAAARRERAATRVALDGLQRHLGTAIKVLPVDAADHPAVVRSFDGRDLPACVLLRHGVELWRQQGLPDGAGLAALLLQSPPGAATGPLLPGNPPLKP